MKISTCLLLIAVVAADKHRDPQEHYREGGDHDAKFDAEAFLGKDQVDEWQELSPEESAKKLKMLVPVIDKNGDGEITEEELKDHIDFMQKRYVEKDVERTWNNYDVADIKDDKIDWAAYRKMVYGPEGQDTSDEYKKMIERDRRRWSVSDVDKDDKMTKIEYACFMHPEDCSHLRDIVTQETIEDIDKDGDGLIDLKEYIADIYRPEDYPELKGVEPEWVASERDMFTEHRDKDSDGKLNIEEMKAWVAPENFDHAEAEAKHLITVADDDKDNKLSLDEILAHVDVFVGSQATDYGEQLQKHDPSEL